MVQNAVLLQGAKGGIFALLDRFAPETYAKRLEFDFDLGCTFLPREFEQCEWRIACNLQC